MKSLMEIYNSSGDMYGQKSDKGTIHSYMETYENILEPYRSETCNFLEIGAACGASFPIWHEYFYNSKILSIDNGEDKSCGQDVVEEFSKKFERLKFFKNTDAYKIDTVNTMLDETDGNGFEIIIDDGSHIPKHQGFVLVEYGKILRPGGLIIIEDIVNDTVINFLQNMPMSYEFSFSVQDLRSKKNRSDDIMLIVRKEYHG